jgi:hypothetical protein
MQEIEESVAAYPDLVLKLHEGVARSLGDSMRESLSVAFDEKLAAQSLCLFDLAKIPGIRGTLPNGVSDVHFTVDLSALHPQSLDAFVSLDPGFAELLPRKKVIA